MVFIGAAKRPKRKVDPIVKRAIKKMRFPLWKKLRKRGPLNKDVLDKMVEGGRVTREQADTYLFEDKVRSEINELITDFQVSEHDAARDRVAMGERFDARWLTPPSDLSKATYMALKEKKLVSCEHQNLLEEGKPFAATVERTRAGLDPALTRVIPADVVSYG